MDKEAENEVVLFLQKEYSMSQADAVAALNQWKNILDMVIDGVWVGLNILGPMSFAYTTRQGHTVEISFRSISN